jgi:hypothetical protein
MLIAIGENGFMAHASFQTQTLLAMLQLEYISFAEVDLDRPPKLIEPEAEF